MKRILFLIFLLLSLSVADENVTIGDKNISDANISNDVHSLLLEMKMAEQILKEKQLKEAARKKEEAAQKARALAEKKRQEAQRRAEERRRLALRIAELDEHQKAIDDELATDNMWVSEYLPYESYQDFNMKLEKLAKEVKYYHDKKNLSKSEESALKKLEEEYKIVSGKISQLSEYKTNPFEELIKPIKLEEEPVISNPLDIITAMSYQKHLKGIEAENAGKYTALSEAVVKIRKSKRILQELALLSDNKKYVEALRRTKKKLKDFELAQEVFETYVKTFSQKVSQININLDKGIEEEIKRSIVTGVIILILLLVFLMVKYLVRKYMSDNDLFYGINKVINFVFIFLIFIILLLSYLENIENLMTILSFASAGIAIALKDWFMSLLGWLVILVSGSIHVGDRVKFVKDGVEYVGDVVDISMLRITLHEDVTLTTIMLNKRSGRIVFIPNNYIFTDMIANYSHSGLKTVWDGVEFIITFDSNIAKAQAIAKEVTRKYSKGYTDMTRKQLNRLRSKYSVRNTGVEPRIFTIFEPYGMRVSAWYLTNSYATLTLRTTISVEILKQINEADDIHLALPSQSLYMNESLEERMALKSGEEPSENHKA